MSNIILTVDGLITFDNKVVLIRRAKPPFMDKLVMPGGHVDGTDHSTVEACARELHEETDLVIEPKNLQLLMVLDDPLRDPRPGRRISIVYRAHLLKAPQLQAGDDAKEIMIRELASLHPEEIGFDHWEALKLVIK